VEKTLWFGPRLDLRPFTSFFSAASAFGIITLSQSEVRVRVIEGELPLEKLVLANGNETRTLEWKTVVRPDVAATRSIEA